MEERPTAKGYDVATEHAFLSMPSGHAASSFAAACYAATDNLLSHPEGGSTEHVFPGGGKGLHAGGHEWLVTAVGYLLGTGAGIGISSLAY